MVEPYAPDVGGILSNYYRTEAITNDANATAALRDQQMREKAQGIVMSAARSMWSRVKDIQDPAEQQKQADKLREAMRPYMRTALGPLYQESPGPVNLEQVRTVAEMPSMDERFYGNVVQDEQGNAYQVSDRGRLQKVPIPGRTYQKPMTFNQGAGGTTVSDPRAPMSPVGNYPTVPEEREGYRPGVASAPPPVTPGGTPSEAVPNNGNGGVSLRFSNQADLDAWVNSYVQERGRQPQAPAAQPAPVQPAGRPAPTPQDPTMRVLPPPPRTFSQQNPVYPGGASNPDFIKHKTELDRSTAAGRMEGELPGKMRLKTYETNEDIRGADARNMIDVNGDYMRKINDAYAGQFAEIGKNAQNARQALEIIPPDIDNLIETATGSGAGAVLDAAGRLVGVSTDGAEAIAKLQALGGWLTSHVPRMQGPQSDRDVELYRQMAGDISAPGIPAEQKRAALRTVVGLLQKYQDAPFTFGQDNPPVVPPQPMGGRMAPNGMTGTGATGGRTLTIEQAKRERLQAGDFLQAPNGKRFRVKGLRSDGKPVFEEMP